MIQTRSMEESILVKINKAALRFLEPMSPEQTYETIISEAIKLIDADYGSIFLEIDGDLKRAYASLPFLYTVKSRRRANTYKAFKSKKTIIAPADHFGKTHPHLQKYGIKWTVFIPLAYGNKSMGVLNINSSKDIQFNEKELGILSLYGSLASMAIRKTQLYSETKKTLEIRDFFLALSAQELRTPLTTINGYINLLKSKMKDPNSSEYKWIHKLSDESTKLTSIVHEMLEINKMKTGRTQFIFRECHIREIVHMVTELFHKKYPERELIISDNIKQKHDALIGDAQKLIQVIINILENAAQYSPADTPITVEVRTIRQKLIINITDKGKGIDSKDLPYIFEGMYKPDYNQEHGMIIGLFMAKNIIERHNGTISVKSTTNKGTTVNIILPLAKI